MIIRNVRAEDLSEITELELRAFEPEAAADRESFEYRLRAFPESFFVAETDGRVIGYVNGGASNRKFITDDLFEPGQHCPIGENQMIFGLVVSPFYRNHGVGTALLNQMIEYAKKTKKKAIVLTCKETLVPYYEKLGFACAGISKSEIGGILWKDMVKSLQEQENNRRIENEYVAGTGKL